MNVPRLLFITLALLSTTSACPDRRAQVAPPGAAAAHDFRLQVDPLAVDRVELLGDIPSAPLALAPRGKGLFERRVTGLKRGHAYRYRFRVHRKDLDRWIVVTDPLAWQLDASVERWAVLQAGTDAPPHPRKLAPRPFSELVIYELCPREVVAQGTLYADQSSVRKKPLLGRVFQRLEERVRSGYFERLGVNTLELMPVLAQGWLPARNELPRRRPPWGYQALSWYAINGDFGSAADLTRLIDSAHQHGLHVLADFSLEHGYGGRENGLITDLWPRWRVARPKNPWGLLELDLRQPAARRFVIGALRRLLVDFGFDGLRLDWTEKVPVELWTEIVREVRRFKPDAILISENPVLPLLTKSGFDGVWDFFFQWEAPLLLRRVYRNWDGFAGRLVDTQRKLVENLEGRAFPPHGAKELAGLDPRRAPQVVRYLESHDLPRIARARVRWQHGGDHLLDVDGDKKTPDWLDGGSQVASRLGIVLLATLPGAIMIFQGQEHGADDELVWAYDPLRWQDAQADTLAHYRKLLQLRKAHAELRSNDLRVLLSDTKQHLLIYARGDAFVVVLNFGSATAKTRLALPRGGEWQDLLSSRRFTGSSVDLQVPAQGAMLWQRQAQARGIKSPVSTSR